MEFLERLLWVIEYMLDLCFVYPRRQSSSDHLPQPFHLHVTYRTLNLTPLLLFIRPWTNQHSRPKPKAQYTILGPYPYNSPSKLRFFPPIWGEKVGFLFFRIKTIHFFSSHVRDYRFACPIIKTIHFFALGGTLFPVSNGETRILQLIFFLEFWVG